MYDFMAKRQKLFDSDGIDRISVLPIPILHHILSFIETPKVVQTCILSKTWRNIWRSVPTLDFFKVDEYTAAILDMVKFIDSLLFLRDGVNIQKLCLLLNEVDMSKAKVWITYAMRHNVEFLDIRNFTGESIPMTHILNSDGLKEFKLLHNDLDLPASISLPALKTLNLRRVRVKEGQLEVLISATPSLETFILDDCTVKGSKLVLSSSHLKNLEISGEIPSSVVISTPNLVCFKFSTYNKPPATIAFDCDLLSLSDANIGNVDICSQSRSQLLSTVRNARSLTLSGNFFWAYVRELRKDDALLNCIQIPFYNLKRLELRTNFEGNQLASIHDILKCSPEIESIVLANQGWSTHDTEAEKPKYKLSHLKFVEIQDFGRSVNEVTMIQFLLENAIVLEEMVITIPKNIDRSSQKNQKFMDLGKKILKFPRASLSVGILYG